MTRARALTAVSASEVQRVREQDGEMSMRARDWKDARDLGERDCGADATPGETRAISISEIAMRT
jgi:hypothetical protein